MYTYTVIFIAFLMAPDHEYQIYILVVALYCNSQSILIMNFQALLVENLS